MTETKVKQKKPIYKKWWAWLIAIILLFIFIPTDDDEGETKNPNQSQTANASEDNSSKEEPKEEPKKDDGSYEVNKTDELLGLEINISKVVLTEKELLVDMVVKNTTEGTISFYPDQGSAIIGSKQIEANMFMTKGDVSGDIFSGVEKEGTIKFVLKDKGIDISGVEEIRFEFGNVGDSDYNYENYSTTIEIK